MINRLRGQGGLKIDDTNSGEIALATDGRCLLKLLDQFSFCFKGAYNKSEEFDN